MIPVEYKKEGKEIIEKVDNLTSWERIELVKYLADKYLSNEEFEEMIHLYGYIKEEDIDPVQDVIDNGLEMEVLEHLTDEEITDYLIDTGNGARDILEYMLDRSNYDDIADSLQSMNRSDFINVIERIKDNYPEMFLDVFKKILNIK